MQANKPSLRLNKTPQPSAAGRAWKALGWGALACAWPWAFAAHADLSVQTSLQWVSFLRHTEIASSAANPDNRPFRLPDLEFLSELRPSLKLGAAPGLTFVARPLLRFVGQGIEAGAAPRRESTWADAFFNELYGNLVTGSAENLSVSYGIQNVQWGPAELASPSNPVFRELSTDRSYFLLTRGRLLWRANAGFGKGIALTALGETGALAPPVGERSDAFDTKAALKLELSSASGSSQAALIGAVRGRARPFFGAFAQWELLDGVSFYGDAGVTRGTNAWYPERTAGSPVGRFAQSKGGPDFRNAEAVLGLRGNLERGTDLRLEAYLQTAGWSKTELKDALRVATAPVPDYERNLQSYSTPGTILPGRRYLYFSLREPGIPLFDSSEAALRCLYSLTDGSLRVFAVLESNVADAAQIFLSSSISVGKADLELTRDSRWGVIAGHRLSW